MDYLLFGCIFGSILGLLLFFINQTVQDCKDVKLDYNTILHSLVEVKEHSGKKIFYVDIGEMKISVARRVLSVLKEQIKL